MEPKKYNDVKTEPADQPKQEERPGRVAYAPGVADHMENATTVGPTAAAAPEPPKPYPAPGYPKVLFSIYDALPPRLVYNEEEQAKLDKRKWTTIPPENDKEKEKWPKVFFREAPKIINNAREAAELGGEWQEFQMPNLPEGGPTSEPAHPAAIKHER